MQLPPLAAHEKTNSGARRIASDASSKVFGELEAPALFPSDVFGSTHGLPSALEKCAVPDAHEIWAYADFADATLKRGNDGVYHHAGKHRLHRYLTGFDFRYNAREVSYVQRRDFCIKQVRGKRLKYRDSCETKA